VTPPTRDADRDRTAAIEDSSTVDADCLFPSLDTGITLLDIENDRGVSVVQSFALDHLLAHDGPAFWVDANGYASTTSLARLAPSQRLLDRIHVARGFTAYQHYGALCDLSSAVNQHLHQSMLGTADTPAPPSDSPPQPPALVVTPALDAQYRTDDTLGDDRARSLLARALAQLDAYARGYDVPVLVTRTTADAFTEPIETAADHHVRCAWTQLGPKFVAEEFETHLYPVDGGAYYQTTLAYWQQILDARAQQVGVEASASSLSKYDEVGTGVITDGTTSAVTPDPLADAWANVAGVGGR
jgi:hypothetical protein